MTKPIVLVMGVAGVGKTTVAKALAKALEVPFQEGDSLHPEANVAKMRSGKPLDDVDRGPWLDRIADQMAAWRAAGSGGVVTCSALKRDYRDRVIGGSGDVRLVHLHGTPNLIRQRMAARRDHYMPVSLLDSQLATLEPPAPQERAIVVDIQREPAEIVVMLIEKLG